MRQTVASEVKKSLFTDVLSEKYLAYALSTIMSRSLPDVRDGLKPVHRRLLYAMRQLKLDPASGYKKCARVVGDVIGKFHPHGEAAVYDALVRLAQDFSARYPLIDGQGNFGNIDGDSAAAMRYTESKLTLIAEALLEGIDEDAVDFRVTYDNEGAEPSVLPARIPNLLANGASGIAVGMATNIPPHNIEELCSGLIKLIEKPSVSIEELVDLIPGPDFPTGGVLVESKETIIENYKSGKGRFCVEAKWEEEKLPNGMWQIIVKEIPFQVQKSRLIEKIADLLHQKKLSLLSDVRDESAEDIRLVLVPKSRNVDPKMLMESLFRQTELRSNFNLNMNVLDRNNTPQVMSLKQVLSSFLDHRKEVLIRRSKYRLEKVILRLEILEGYLVAYANLDEIIKIIREEDHPKPVLMTKFHLTDNQAEAILNLRLRALRKLEEQKIQGEFNELEAERTSLEELLANERTQWKVIKKQIKEVQLKFGSKGVLPLKFGKRKTELGEARVITDLPIEAFVEKEPVTIIASKKNWLRILKGHQNELSDLKYKEGDEAGQAIKSYTTDKLLVFTKSGRFYTLPVDKLPGGRGFGEPLRLMVDIAPEDDFVDLFVFAPEQSIIVASDDGRGFIVKSQDVIAQTKSGKQVLTVPKGSYAKFCRIVNGDHVAVIGQNRKLLIFPIDQLPVMTKGRGLILQRYKDGTLSDVVTFSMKEGLTVKKGKKIFREEQLLEYLGTRAQAGRLPPHGFPRNNKFD